MRWSGTVLSKSKPISAYLCSWHLSAGFSSSIHEQLDSGAPCPPWPGPPSHLGLTRVKWGIWAKQTCWLILKQKAFSWMVQCTQPSLCPDRLVKLDLPFFFHRNRTQRYWGQTLQQNSGAVTFSPALSIRLAAFWSLMPPKKGRYFKSWPLKYDLDWNHSNISVAVVSVSWSSVLDQCCHLKVRVGIAPMPRCGWQQHPIKICQFVFLGSHHKCYSICFGLHQIIWIHEFVHMNKWTK